MIVGHNGIGDGFINIIGAPYGDCLLTGSVGFHQGEGILIYI